jgi:nucleotide-binding universal stress UspA family protein
VVRTDEHSLNIVRSRSQRSLQPQSFEMHSNETHLGEGRADKEIVRLAEEIGAGRIVMGSRGRGRIRRALMGSVSDSVVRHAHSPVTIVRE